MLLRLAPGFARLTDSLEVDDRAIRDELGWRAPFSFEQGLQATAQWYRAQGG
jgi:UDP-glucose 4-epimerase